MGDCLRTDKQYRYIINRLRSTQPFKGKSSIGLRGWG